MSTYVSHRKCTLGEFAKIIGMDIKSIDFGFSHSKGKFYAQNFPDGYSLISVKGLSVNDKITKDWGIYDNPAADVPGKSWILSPAGRTVQTVDLD